MPNVISLMLKNSPLFFPLFFFFCSLFGYEEGPWLPSFLEWEAQVGHHYMHTKRVESPEGSFSYLNDYHNPFVTMGMSISPTLFVEGYLGFLQNNQYSFSYESFAFRLRKQWLDDLLGDFISATTSASLTIAPTRLLHDFGYPFHGYCNAEIDLSIGKEVRDTSMEWQWRFWGLIGIGMAERGSPWVRGNLTLAQALSPCASFDFFADFLYGLGKQNIIDRNPFPGYGSIRHQIIDLGIVYHYYLGAYTTLSLSGYVNVHARNFIENSYGCTLFINFIFW